MRLAINHVADDQSMHAAGERSSKTSAFDVAEVASDRIARLDVGSASKQMVGGVLFLSEGEPGGGADERGGSTRDQHEQLLGPRFAYELQDSFSSMNGALIWYGMCRAQDAY